MKIAELREIGAALGREGMSKKAITAIEAFDGSYRGAMQLCGKLSVIAKMATCDEYWLEQVKKGEYNMNYTCEEYVRIESLKNLKRTVK